jgi:urate oxidase
MARLSSDSYGKSDVRVTKVVRDGGRHTLLELTVAIELGGAFAPIYTKGDNSPCIPTDTMKNTVYALAKQSDFASPEEFAALLASHFLDDFGQVDWAEVSVEQTLWERIPVGGRPSGYAFAKAGSDSRTSFARRERSGPARLRGGLEGLEVVRTGGSSFTGFLRDRYTTLKETSDRIMATSIDATWDYVGTGIDYNATFEKARRTILETFATHESRSVQHTIYAMGEALLAAVPAIASVDFGLPNQHRLPVNLEPFGLGNDNDIFVATSEPYGLIKGSVARE